MMEVKWLFINIELLQVEIFWCVGYENVDYFVKLFCVMLVVCLVIIVDNLKIVLWNKKFYLNFFNW